MPIAGTAGVSASRVQPRAGLLDQPGGGTAPGVFAVPALGAAGVDQDEAVAGQAIVRAPAGHPVSAGVRATRQGDGEPGAQALAPARRGDRAAVRRDQGAGNSQSDAGSAVGAVAGRVGAVEPFEDVR